jgi:hypothetical protein
VSDALKSQHQMGGNDTITLTDNTTVTFLGVSNLTTSDFITSAGGGGVDVGGGNNGHGGHDHGHDDHRGLRDSVFDHH